MNIEKKNNALSRAMYGMADIYGGGAFVIIGTFFTVFLTKALGMPTACLLYTSPSPRDISGSRMPSSA